MRGLTPIGIAINRAVSSAITTSSQNGADLGTSVPELQRRISELQSENATLRGELFAIQESNVQQKLLTEKKLHGVQARLIARSPDPGSSYIIVDRGGDDGIQQGAPALIRDGVLVGKVISTTNDTARILLSTDNRSSFAGYNIAHPAAQGVINGVQGLTMTMELIPQSEIIDLHDIIVTSGLDPAIPRGFVIGEIERIDRQQGALFQSATLHTPYTNAELDIVSVITSFPK